MATKNILTNNKSSCLITPETSKKLENEDIIFVNLKVCLEFVKILLKFNFDYCYLHNRKDHHVVI